MVMKFVTVIRYIFYFKFIVKKLVPNVNNKNQMNIQTKLCDTYLNSFAGPLTFQEL